MTELITASEIKLAELLRKGRFAVPRHQRYYDWEEEHVSALLSDLSEAVDEKVPCYFLGSIMLIKDQTGLTEKWEVNDGQQRIITFSLICAYLCRILQGPDSSSQENKIIRVLFDIPEAHSKKLSDTDSISPRITPPKNNKIDFNNLIRGHDVRRNGKMILAWKSIVAFFDEKKHQGTHWRADMLHFMLNEVSVVQLEVDKKLDIHAIFETLNSRGKTLDQVDLIKNYFLSLFGEDRQSAGFDTVHDGFEKIYTSFSGKSASEYVRCYMQAEHGFINKERFFRETKKLYRNPKNSKTKQVLDLVNGLSKSERIEAFKTFSRKSSSSDFLRQLTIDAGKSRKRIGIHDYLQDLHDYGIARPIMFALFCRYLDYANTDKKKEVAVFVYKCAQNISSFVQRVSHTGNFRPSVYEENFATLAKSVYFGACYTTKQFFNKLMEYDRDRIIDNKNYIDMMKIKTYPRNSIKKFKYILKKIVEHQQPEFKIADNQVSVEHILPKSPVHHSKPAWVSEFDANDRERLLHCLGNLTLLSKSDNSPSEVDNESFSAKKKIYKKSLYEITTELGSYDEWTPNEVRKRQLKLVKIAAKQIWHFDER